jgi:hypothetical protein
LNAHAIFLGQGAGRLFGVEVGIVVDGDNASPPLVRVRVRGVRVRVPGLGSRLGFGFGC